MSEDKSSRDRVAGWKTGRQQYRDVQVVQLMLWTLELVQTVWRMPRCRRASWRREALHALKSACSSNLQGKAFLLSMWVFR
jgi:hypothetical protein